MASNSTISYDCRGVPRGRCINIDCPCDGYYGGSEMKKCVKCAHPPGKHQNMAQASGSSAAGSAAATPTSSISAFSPTSTSSSDSAVLSSMSSPLYAAQCTFRGCSAEKYCDHSKGVQSIYCQQHLSTTDKSMTTSSGLATASSAQSSDDADSGNDGDEESNDGDEEINDKSRETKTSQVNSTLGMNWFSTLLETMLPGLRRVFVKLDESHSSVSVTTPTPTSPSTASTKPLAVSSTPTSVVPTTNARQLQSNLKASQNRSSEIVMCWLTSYFCKFVLAILL